MKVSLPLERRCTAHSKWAKRECHNPAIPGGSVCRFHGGAAPQVIRAAQRRLAIASHPAIKEMLADVGNALKPSASQNTILKAERALRLFLNASKSK